MPNRPRAIITRPASVRRNMKHKNQNILQKFILITLTVVFAYNTFAMPCQASSRMDTTNIVVDQGTLNMSAEDGERHRVLVDIPLGSNQKLMANGFQMDVTLSIGTNRSSNLLGHYGLGFMFSPRSLAEDEKIGAFNPGHVIYIDQRANAQWEILHYCVKVAGEPALDDVSFFRELSNDLRMVVRVIGPSKDRALLQYYVNGSIRAEAEIDWSRIDYSLSLAFENRNANSEITALRIIALDE